jgi:hypothetical protein
MGRDSSSPLAVPAYPLLAAAYFVFALAGDNSSELIPLKDLARPVLYSIALAIGVWAPAAGATGGLRQGALVAGVGVVCFSLFGYLAAYLRGPLDLIGGSAGLLFLLLFVVLASALLVRRHGGTYRGLTRYLNVVSALLLTFAVLRVAVDASFSRRVETSLDSVQRRVIPASGRSDQLRDIYLILLDKYTGSELLQRNYGFDNRPFEDSLRARGFIAPPGARTNYIHTSLALAAMLNLEYLDALTSRFGADNGEWELVYPMVEEHRLAAFLRERGYVYAFFPSAFPATRQSRVADVQLPEPSEIRPEFEAVWLWTTPVPVIHAGACRLLGCQVNRFSYTPESAELLDWKLAQLETVATGPRPFLVFAHLTLPHEPYVYDEHCAHREPYWPLEDVSDSVAVKEAYVAQIKCLNRKLLTLVDALRAKGRSAPVILLQSDHGHGRLGRLAGGLEEAAPWQVDERVSVFAAYSLPELEEDSVADDITPVNATRLVLRHYFGADLPPLEDATFWSAWARPYRFTRIR